MSRARGGSTPDATKDELVWSDATSQAERVRSGELQPIDLVDAAIARIEAVDDVVNAVVIRRFEQARREALGDLPDGPFRGVPILLKDTAPSQGDPWHAGLRAAKQADYIAPADSHLVNRLRRAGFIVIGRTNVPELCSWPSTEPLAYGPTRNPWAPERTAGGSSGGSGAAVAAGMAPVASGSDGGGSIRLPAGVCGVVGLKPSRGRVSAGPDHGHRWGGLSTDGPMARTVRDAAAVLDVISGTQPGDPYGVAAEAAASTCGQLVEIEPPRLRIGLCPEPPNGAPSDRECADAVRAVGRALEELGHRVEERWPDALADTSHSAHSRVVVAANVAAEIQEWEERIGRSIADDELETINRTYREWARSYTAADYVAAETRLHAYARRLVAWWADHALLVTPVLPIRTPPLGWFSAPQRDGVWAGLFNFLGPFNLTGQPALALPGAWTSDGLPLGVQLVAAVGREDLLVQVGAQLESVLAWQRRRPPLGGSA